MKTSSQNHSFNIDVAMQCGPIAAIVYNHLHYWITHNRIAGTGQQDGKTWTYQSRSTMLEYLPYLTDKELRTALDKLVDSGYIIKGEFNKNKFDHTTWYSFPDSKPCQKGRDSNNVFDDAKRANPCSEKGQSLGSERANPSIYSKDKKEDDKQQQQEVVVVPAAHENIIDKNEICKADIHRMALSRGWSSQEVEYAWKAFEPNKNLVNSPWDYIEGIILKSRTIQQAKKSKQKEKSCQTNEITQEKQKSCEQKSCMNDTGPNLLAAFAEQLLKPKAKLCSS